jgi:hypothetical protein
MMMHDDIAMMGSLCEKFQSGEILGDLDVSMASSTATISKLRYQ